jgi:hypothetical protein
MPMVRRLIVRRPGGGGDPAVWSGEVDDIALEVNDRHTSACCRHTAFYAGDFRIYPALTGHYRDTPKWMIAPRPAAGPHRIDRRSVAHTGEQGAIAHGLPLVNAVRQASGRPRIRPG